MAPPVFRLHALCSPSSAKRWLSCPGSVAMEDGERDTESSAATDGTLTHDLSAKWLTHGAAPAQLLADSDRHARTQVYIDWVHERERHHREGGAKVETFVEVGLPLEGVTGERNARGTSDVVIIAEYADHAELDVADLKDGYNEVVSTDPQLQIYGLAALQKYGLMLNFTVVHCTVVQPRVSSVPQTQSYSMDEMYAFADVVKQGAYLALTILEDGKSTALGHLQPSDEGCRYCKAQAKCPALVKSIHDTVYGELSEIAAEPLEAIDELNFAGSKEDFSALLPVFFRRVPQIEAWCKYVRAKAETEMISGRQLAGLKLVVGRSGARKWVNESAVLKLCAGSNLPREAFQTAPELRTPADLEKHLKKTYPNVWETVQQFITQAPGSPSVALADDPRPAFSAPTFDGESYDATGLI